VNQVQQVASELGVMAGEKGDASQVRDGGMVVQRVVRAVGGGTVFPVLTKTNYS
jgi:hypothetical protein